MNSEVIEERFSVKDYGCRRLLSRGEPGEALCASRLLFRINKGEIAMLDGESEILEHLYRRGVVETDRQLGMLFANLRAAGLYDRMTIVVTSDHGESFEGPGRFLHGEPFEEVLRVPLLVKWPEGVRAGERTTVATSAVDLAPTLAEAFGLDGEGLAGTSLLAPRPGTAIFAGTYDHVVVRGGWKAVFPLRGEPRLFDLKSDPEERRDVADEQPEHVAELEKLLRRRLRSERKLVVGMRREEGADERLFSRKEIERLESLGYVGNDG
jgi:arylsulfatase A-like enzyme